MSVIRWLISIILIMHLSACGTLIRTQSEQSTFRGADAGQNEFINIFDKDFNLLIAFGYLVIGMPVDAIFDVVLYPVDKVVEEVKEKAKIKQQQMKRKQFLETHYELKLITANTTNYSYINYRISNQMDKKYGGALGYMKYDYTGYYNYILPKPYTVDKTVDIVWLPRGQEEIIKNPHQYGSDDWHKYNSENGVDDVYYKQTLEFPDFDDNTNFFVLVFLPCKQVALYASSEKEINNQWINSIVNYKSQYKHLLKLENLGVCPTVIPYQPSSKELM